MKFNPSSSLAVQTCKCTLFEDLQTLKIIITRIIVENPHQKLKFAPIHDLLLCLKDLLRNEQRGGISYLIVALVAMYKL